MPLTIMPRTVVGLTVLAPVIITGPTLPALRMRAQPMTTIMSTTPATATPGIMAMLTAIRIPMPVPMSMRRLISAGLSRSASA